MSHIGFEDGFPLDPWIDTQTGQYDKRSADELLKALSVCAADIVYKAMKGCPAPKSGIFSPDALDLKLSTELLYRKSAGMSLKEIKKYLDGIIEEMPDGKLIRLKEALAGVKDVRALRRSAEVRQAIIGIPADNEKVRKLLFEIERKESLILAKSFPSADPNKLWDFTIYPKAVAICRRTPISSFDAVFWATLAHDTFHAYHYSLFVEKGMAERWNDRAFAAESRIVKESIGVAFEYNYILGSEMRGTMTAEQSDALRREMQNEWLGINVTDWAYSGALGIVDQAMPDRSLAEVGQILDRSLEGWALPAEAIKAGYYTAKVRRALKA